MKKSHEILMDSPLFSGMKEEEVQSILGCLHAGETSYQKGEYILRSGDLPDSIGILLAGNVFIIAEDYWGNRDIRAGLIPGQIFADAFACLPGTPMDVSVIAEKDSQVLWLRVQQILTTCPSSCSHHSRMIHNLLSVLASNNLKLNAKVTHISKRTTREKLLSYLSAEAKRQGKSDFVIPFNRQQLADYLSVERSAMSAELSRMQRDGLIYTSRNAFSLYKDQLL